MLSITRNLAGFTLPQYMKGEELLAEYEWFRKGYRANQLSETQSIRGLELKTYIASAVNYFKKDGKAVEQESDLVFAVNALAIAKTSPVAHLWEKEKTSRIEDVGGLGYQNLRVVKK